MPKKKPSISPENAAQEWIELKAEKLRIERRSDELRKVLEPYLEKKKEGFAILAGWKFSLVETTRESFRLKEAKEKLGLSVLRPFLTSSSYSQIRTFWSGGDEAEAA